MFICFDTHSNYGRTTVSAIKVNRLPITASLLHNEGVIDSTNNSSALTVAVYGTDSKRRYSDISGCVIRKHPVIDVLNKEQKCRNVEDEI